MNQNGPKLSTYQASRNAAERGQRDRALPERRACGGGARARPPRAPAARRRRTAARSPGSRRRACSGAAAAAPTTRRRRAAPRRGCARCRRRRTPPCRCWASASRRAPRSTPATGTAAARRGRTPPAARASARRSTATRPERRDEHDLVEPRPGDRAEQQPGEQHPARRPAPLPAIQHEHGGRERHQHRAGLQAVVEEPEDPDRARGDERGRRGGERPLGPVAARQRARLQRDQHDEGEPQQRREDLREPQAGDAVAAREHVQRHVERHPQRLEAVRVVDAVRRDPVAERDVAGGGERVVGVLRRQRARELVGRRRVHPRGRGERDQQRDEHRRPAQPGEGPRARRPCYSRGRHLRPSRPGMSSASSGPAVPGS